MPTPAGRVARAPRATRAAVAAPWAAAVAAAAAPAGVPVPVVAPVAAAVASATAAKPARCESARHPALRSQSVTMFQTLSRLSDSKTGDRGTFMGKASRFEHTAGKASWHSDLQQPQTRRVHALQGWNNEG